jgi:hypothetical protein
LWVRRTYPAGPGSQTQEALCEGCQRKYVVASTVVGEIDQFGVGAFALATQLRRGDAEIDVVRP